MFVLSNIVASILGVISLLHFYWAFGGRYGFKSAGPKIEGKPEFIPGKLLILLVACLLMGLAVLAIQLESPWPPIKDYLPNIGYFVSVIFIIRAIGDFRYVGLFKRIYNSNFAKLDTKYFSPLVLFLGVSFVVLLWPCL